MKIVKRVSFFGLIVFICSCSSKSDEKVNNQIKIPLFDLEEIDSNTIYISHPILNNRAPTLIKLGLNLNKEKDSIILIESERFQSGTIKTSMSRVFEFNMKFEPFPNVNNEVLKIKPSNKSRIRENAYFFVIPNCNASLFLDNSNVNTDSGQKVLKWLKRNISRISIYEQINIWSLEQGKSPTDSTIKSFREKNYILHERFDLNREL